LPGREDVVATLPPGLLVYRAAEQEVFVAIAGGLLDLERGVCRVLTRDAVASDDLDAVSDIVLRHVQRRSERREEQSGIMEELVREALRRLAARERV
jgi:F0F1-type ATP synthase epsilon subunit